MSKKCLHWITLSYILALAAGCAATSWDQVRDSEDIDELRAYIQDNKQTLWADQARQRIEMLEHRAAVRTGTRYAYNLFLQRHPDSVYSHQIRRRLEELEFEDVKAAPTPDHLLRFLQAWPRGRLAGRARAMLEQSWCRHWGDATDPQALDAFLQLHPQLACRRALEKRHEELLFNRAISSQGTAGLIRFLHAYPASTRTRTVRARLAQRLARAYVQASRFDRAERIIREHAAPDDQQALQQHVATARVAWLRASFDPRAIRASLATLDEHLSPQTSEQLHRWSKRLQNHRSLYRPLAEATAVLRQAARWEALPATLPPDPRSRWLLADRLATMSDERSADTLLGMLGDPFLEVRLRAWRGLGLLVESLGPVRADAWIARNREELRQKARSGILLLRLAVLCQLSGERERALGHLETLLQSAEEPSLFSQFLAIDLCVQLGRHKQAATIALNMVRRARTFAAQRTGAWHTGDEALQHSQSGWISLRQLQGLASLWQESLTHFRGRTDSAVRVSASEGLLGPWLSNASEELDTLVSWLAEEERDWAQRNPGYTPSTRPAASTEDSSLRRQALQSLGRLVLSGQPEAWVTIHWARCCHPRPSLREAARQWTSAIAWVSATAGAAGGFCCPPIDAHHHEKTCQPR